MIDIALKDEATELIEAIYDFKEKYAKDLNSLETIIEFCYKHDLDLQEVGEILAEHTEYTKILEQELISQKYSRNFIKSEKIDEKEW
jgi:hypothetical protein